jgi:hypothetical protein
LTRNHAAWPICGPAAGPAPHQAVHGTRGRGARGADSGDSARRMGFDMRTQKRSNLIHSADSCDSARRESRTRASPRLGQPGGAPTSGPGRGQAGRLVAAAHGERSPPSLFSLPLCLPPPLFLCLCLFRPGFRRNRSAARFNPRRITRGFKPEAQWRTATWRLTPEGRSADRHLLPGSWAFVAREPAPKRVGEWTAAPSRPLGGGRRPAAGGSEPARRARTPGGTRRQRSLGQTSLGRDGSKSQRGARNGYNCWGACLAGARVNPEALPDSEDVGRRSAAVIHSLVGREATFSEPELRPRLGAQARPSAAFQRSLDSPGGGGGGGASLLRPAREWQRPARPGIGTCTVARGPPARVSAQA